MQYIAKATRGSRTVFLFLSRNSVIKVVIVIMKIIRNYDNINNISVNGDSNE